MRTGTRTLRAPPPSTSAPAIISGRWRWMASRTFSLCRSQSRAPRENSSYQPVMAVALDSAMSSVKAVLPAARCRNYSCASSVVT